MAERIIQYQRGTENAEFGPVSRAFDITPSTTELQTITRAITVSTEGATVTGYLEFDDEEFTTHPLSWGTMYPMKWRKITAVSAGTVKGYA